MIFTIPVLLYQLLFVLILFIASRFGNKKRPNPSGKDVAGARTQG